MWPLNSVQTYHFQETSLLVAHLNGRNTISTFHTQENENWLWWDHFESCELVSTPVAYCSYLLQLVLVFLLVRDASRVRPYLNLEHLVFSSFWYQVAIWSLVLLLIKSWKTAFVLVQREERVPTIGALVASPRNFGTSWTRPSQDARIHHALQTCHMVTGAWVTVRRDVFVNLLSARLTDVRT